VRHAKNRTDRQRRKTATHTQDSIPFHIELVADAWTRPAIQQHHAPGRAIGTNPKFERAAMAWRPNSLAPNSLAPQGRLTGDEGWVLE